MATDASGNKCRRDRQLIQQRLLGARRRQPGRADQHRGRGPQQCSQHTTGIAEQRLAVARANAVGKGSDDAGKRNRDAEPLDAGKPLVRNPPCQAERGEHRRKVDEDHHARCQRVPEAEIDQEKFDGEQQARGQTHPQRAVAAEQGDAARPGPTEQEQRRQQRADAALHHHRDAGCADLDRHLLQPPQQGADDHHPVGGRVERAARVHCA